MGNFTVYNFIIRIDTYLNTTVQNKCISQSAYYFIGAFSRRGNKRGRGIPSWETEGFIKFAQTKIMLNIFNGRKSSEQSKTNAWTDKPSVNI